MILSAITSSAKFSPPSPHSHRAQRHPHTSLTKVCVPLSTTGNARIVNAKGPPGNRATLFYGRQFQRRQSHQNSLVQDYVRPPVLSRKFSSFYHLQHNQRLRQFSSHTRRFSPVFPGALHNSQKSPLPPSQPPPKTFPVNPQNRLSPLSRVRPTEHRWLILRSQVQAQKLHLHRRRLPPQHPIPRPSQPQEQPQ